MERTKKNKILLFGLLMVIVLALPLTVFILQKQQENRSKASAATTLFFTPEGTTETPVQKTVGDTVTVDLMVNPGINLVSLVRYSITYNPLYVSPATSNAFVLNSTAFKKNVEGPIYDPINGTISGSVSIGSDYTDAIQSLTKVATLNFKTTAISNGTTPIGFGSETEVYSLASTEIANENVLASAVPTILSINAVPTATPTPTPAPVTGSLTATPNPCTIPFGQTECSMTLNWTTQNASDVRLEIVGGATTTVTASGSKAIIAQPVSTTYKLYAGTQLLDSITTSTVIAPTPTPTIQACLQVITYAKNPTTNECKSYASPCNVPTGWTTVDECPAPTPTPIGKTTFIFSLLLHGIGNSGDNVNKSSLGSNKNPLTKVRNIQLSLVDVSGAEKFNTTLPVTFDSTTGSFTGQSNFGPAENFNLIAGVYQLKIKTDRYLRKQIPLIQINPGTTITVQPLTLVNGDANNDNTLNVLDYNMIMDCYSDVLAARACNDANKKLMTDLTDDGKVNQYDYNLFLRELSVQVGE